MGVYPSPVPIPHPTIKIDEGQLYAVAPAAEGESSSHHEHYRNEKRSEGCPAKCDAMDVDFSPADITLDDNTNEAAHVASGDQASWPEPKRQKRESSADMDITNSPEFVLATANKDTQCQASLLGSVQVSPEKKDAVSSLLSLMSTSTENSQSLAPSPSPQPKNQIQASTSTLGNLRQAQQKSSSPPQVRDVICY
jgi:hypothetical protein